MEINKKNEVKTSVKEKKKKKKKTSVKVNQPI